MRKIHLTVSTAIGALVMGFGGDVLAQSAPQTSLEEIVVTARKRDESLLEVPLAVSALTAKSLESKQIVDLQGVADNTPGFNITNTGNAGGAVGGSRADRGTQNLSIRGVFNKSSVFIDGAPVNSGFVEGVSDLERVEVIKGPQSAYFGRTTFIGAINLVPKAPSNEFKGSGSVLYGSYNWHDIRASVEGPIIKDMLQFRIAARDFSKHGQYDNAGGPDKRLGDQSTQSVTISLAAQPTDKFSAKLFGLYWVDSDGSAAVGKFVRQDYNCNAGGGTPPQLNYYCGVLPKFPEARLGQNTVIDPLYESLVLNNSSGKLSPIFERRIDHGGLERRAFHVNLNMSYELPYGLTLSSLTAVNENKYEVLTDIDMADTSRLVNPVAATRPDVLPYVNWLFYYQILEQDQSQEFRLTSDQSRRLRGTVGFNYTHTFSQNYITQLNPFAGPVANSSGDPLETKTTGVFFSVAYDLLDNLTLNLEGRYQRDKIEQYSRRPNVPLNGTSVTSLQLENTYKNFVPRAILQYKFTPEVMAYATFSRGVSPGTFNTALLNLAPVQRSALSAFPNVGLIVAPEKLDNYELGVKGRFFDNRLQLSAAVYTANWTDQTIVQIVPLPLVDINGNLNGATGITTVKTSLGQTKLQGIEVDGLFQATENLVINFSGAINDSKIKAGSCISPCTEITGSTNIIGKQLPAYSKYSANVGAEYTAQLTDTLNWYARGDYIYKDGQWDTLSNVAKTADQHKVNLRAGVRNDRLTVEAFVTNLFDNRAAVSIERNVDVLSVGFADSDINVGMPLKREFGVRASYNF